MIGMLGLWAFAIGCDATGETADTADTSEATTDPCAADTSGWSGPPQTWDEDGITIHVCGATAGAYDFGMVETGSAAGWGGEDCLDAVPAAYSNVDDEGYQLCHPFDGVQLVLTTVDTPDQVVPGSTTLFGRDDDAGITYVLFESAGTACLTWGDDPGYYDAYGCTVI